MSRLLLVLAAVLCATTAAAPACPVCIAYPRESAADMLLASSHIVLAREDSQRPFHYAVLEVLKSPSEAVRETPASADEVDLFLNTHVRRLLSVDESRRAVLAKDAATGRWRNLGVADAGFQAAVRRVLLFEPQWRLPGGAGERLRFFLPLLAHDDPQVFEMAYLELARAPYDTIRQLGRGIPRRRLQRMLDDRAYLEWRGLAILLLGQSDLEQDRRRLRDSLDRAQRLRLTKYLGAWTAAAIEADGARAVDYLTEHYASHAERTPVELAEVIKVLSLHGGEGRTELRGRIVACYAQLLKTHPRMAGPVARDLTAWKRYDLADQLAAIQQSGAVKDKRTRQAIGDYLRLAKSNRE